MYLTLTSRNILEFPDVFCEEYVSCCRLFDIVEMFDTYNMLRSPFCIYVTFPILIHCRLDFLCMIFSGFSSLQ